MKVSADTEFDDGALLRRQAAIALRSLLRPGTYIGTARELALTAVHAVAYPFGIARDANRRSTSLSDDPSADGLDLGDLVADSETAAMPVILVHGWVHNRSAFLGTSRGLATAGLPPHPRLRLQPADLRHPRGGRDARLRGRPGAVHHRGREGDDHRALTRRDRRQVLRPAVGRQPEGRHRHLSRVAPSRDVLGLPRPGRGGSADATGQLVPPPVAGDVRDPPTSGGLLSTPTWTC